MARGLLDKFNGNFLEVIRIANNCVIHDDEGFYALLSSFKAYTDPLFKKSSFLLKLLGDAGLIELIDPENLVPVMDYHMQRVLLRTACVKIHSSQLEYALKHRLETEHEQEIRANCIEAMKLIAKESGKDILRMNDVFYMLGRSCCLEKPLCIHGECDKTPCSITRSLQLTAHKTCVLAHACEATFDPSYLKFWQPIAFTHYY
jgi:hypothetical protein